MASWESSELGVFLSGVKNSLEGLEADTEPAPWGVFEESPPERTGGQLLRGLTDRTQAPWTVSHVC